jgi:AcrR family transcriptional regulator
MRVLSIIDITLTPDHVPLMARAARRRPEGGVRARTRSLLLDAAVRVFARKGAGAAAIHEIAAEAGVANGTFYNYFRTREELVEAASIRLAEVLDRDIAVSRSAVDDFAERVAIGCRRFIAKAEHDRTWSAALLRVWASSPILKMQAAAGLLADLRGGRRRGRFRFANEQAAIDLVQGTVLSGMRTVLDGHADARHGSLVAALVLRGLGVAADEADDIAERPVPALAPRPGDDARRARARA